MMSHTIVFWKRDGIEKHQAVSNDLVDKLIKNINRSGFEYTGKMPALEFYRQNPDLIPQPDLKPHHENYDPYRGVIVFDQAKPFA